MESLLNNLPTELLVLQEEQHKSIDKRKTKSSSVNNDVSGDDVIEYESNKVGFKRTNSSTRKSYNFHHIKEALELYDRFKLDGVKNLQMAVSKELNIPQGTFAGWLKGRNELEAKIAVATEAEMNHYQGKGNCHRPFYPEQEETLKAIIIERRSKNEPCSGDFIRETMMKLVKEANEAAGVTGGLNKGKNKGAALSTSAATAGSTASPTATNNKLKPSTLVEGTVDGRDLNLASAATTTTVLSDVIRNNETMVNSAAVYMDHQHTTNISLIHNASDSDSSDDEDDNVALAVVQQGRGNAAAVADSMYEVIPTTTANIATVTMSAAVPVMADDGVANKRM